MNLKNTLGLVLIIFIIVAMLAVVWVWANRGVDLSPSNSWETSGTSTAVAPIIHPEGNKLCRALAGDLPELTDSAYDPSLEEPLRCQVVLHPEREPIELTLTKLVTGIELGIGRYDQIVQRIDIPDADRFYPGDILLYEDLNQDGYRDLRLLNTRGAVNEVFDYWLYDPEAGQFEKDPVLFDLFNPEFDPATRTLTARSVDGWAGALYTKLTYEWSGEEYLLVREEKADSGADRDSIITTIREFRDGKWELVSQEEKTLP